MQHIDILQHRTAQQDDGDVQHEAKELNYFYEK